MTDAFAGTIAGGSVLMEARGAVRVYVLRETVHNRCGAFGGKSQVTSTDNSIRIEVDSDKIIVEYCFTTLLNPEQVLNNRLPMSQLVHALFGNGFQNYDSELFLVNGERCRMVGSFTERIPYLPGRQLLLSLKDSVLLLSGILQSQLEYKSSVVDGSLASMSHTNMGGMVNTVFAWAWWGLEWMLQSLEDKYPSRRLLDFPVRDAEGRRQDLRQRFKRAILASIDMFEASCRKDYALEDDAALAMEQDLEELKSRANSVLLRRTVMDKFRRHRPRMMKLVAGFLSHIDSWDSADRLGELLADWDSIEQEIIKPAKRARDVGFHEGSYAGILEGKESKWDIYEGYTRFACFVLNLLSIILHTKPYTFDAQCLEAEPRLRLRPLPTSELSSEAIEIPSNGYIEWNEYHEGIIKRRRARVFGVSLKEGHSLQFNAEERPGEYPLAPFVLCRKFRPAGCILRVGGSMFHGPLQGEGERLSMRIRRFTYDISGKA
jgi:hypothetical protein